MKLICHPISPFARKAMILARWHNISLEEVLPEKDGARGYRAGDNPLGKIPALEWQPGQHLFDSPVICEYLDSLGETPILPASGHARFIQLWQHALGDGLSEAVYNLRYETVRPEALHWPEMIARHETAIVMSVETLNRITNVLGSNWTFGNISIVCALDYANFRAGHLDWPARAPQLADWFNAMRAHPEYEATYGYA